MCPQSTCPDFHVFSAQDLPSLPPPSPLTNVCVRVYVFPSLACLPSHRPNPTLHSNPDTCPHRLSSKATSSIKPTLSLTGILITLHFSGEFHLLTQNFISVTQASKVVILLPHFADWRNAVQRDEATYSKMTQPCCLG